MIRQIVAHGQPVHLDEMVAYLLLRRYGEEKLPGVSTASFRALAQGDSIEELQMRNDVLLLGLGTGSFDEHVFNGDKSKKDECCATLVAQFLNMEQDAHWMYVLRYVLHTDRHRPSLVLDLASSVVRFQLLGWDVFSVLPYVEITVDAALQEQRKFFSADFIGGLEVGKSVRREEIEINGEQHWAAVIEGDNPALVKQARFFGAALVIVKNPQTQQVQILSTNHLRLKMRVVTRVIRYMEQKKGEKILVADWSALEQEGTIEQVPQWFYHKEMENLMNGGRSRPDILPTALTIEEILFAVRTALGTHFIRSRENRCTKGVCTSTRNEPCPWYAFGLPRCIEIRQARRNGNEAKES